MRVARASSGGGGPEDEAAGPTKIRRGSSPPCLQLGDAVRAQLPELSRVDADLGQHLCVVLTNPRRIAAPPVAAQTHCRSHLDARCAAFDQPPGGNLWMAGDLVHVEDRLAAGVDGRESPLPLGTGA